MRLKVIWTLKLQAPFGTRQIRAGLREALRVRNEYRDRPKLGVIVEVVRG